MMLKICTPQM
ncbi:hypothetical protein, partial [Plasmodium yoelii yoelii]